MADDAPAPEPEGESPDKPTPAPEAIEWHAGMTSDELTEAIMASVKSRAIELGRLVGATVTAPRSMTDEVM